MRSRYMENRKDNNSYKSQLVKSIREIIERNSFYELPNLGILVSDLSISDLKKYYSEDDLIQIQDELVALEESDYIDSSLENNDEYLDQLEIINKYKDGAISQIEEDKNSIEEWRTYVPNYIKQRVRNWNDLSLQDFYNEVKSFMLDSTGNRRTELMEYLTDLSQIVFTNDKPLDNEDDDEIIFTDGISESILSIVEMIILPHVEVLEKLKESGGRIKFLNLWNKPFDESLKTSVKDRDEWRCVVCEGETHLHVHHKIPRNLGGMHHKDNLVTLCSSCHKVIETADVKKAFVKCLSNYKRNKLNKSIKSELSHDKSILKDEIETKLDDLLNRLNNKDEHELVQEVIEIINRIEVVFYD